MKIFKKLAAALFSAVIIAVLSVNVSAEKVVGFDYAPAGDDFVYYDFTAEDGATGTLTYIKDDEGNLWFSSYKIDVPPPENPKDFPNYTAPDKDFQQFDDNTDFFEYFETNFQKSNENKLFETIVSKFDVDFYPILSDGTFAMSGGKCYIADIENMTVNYVGYYAEYMDSPYYNCISEYNDKYCECTAEDGSKINILFNAAENGGLEYMGYEAEAAPFDFSYSKDENSQVIISSITVGDIDTGYTLYSDPDMIPLAANEVLAEAETEQYVDEESEFPPAIIEMKKYFVITLNGMNSKVRYAGCSYEVIAIAPEFWQSSDTDWSDSATTSPKTGNSGGYLSVMLAAAVIAVLAKRTEK